MFLKVNPMNKPLKGIVVDGACSVNPGFAEYRGVDLVSREILFQNNMPHGTNNIAEFIAIVHALMFCKKNNIIIEIFSDSVTAITWVRNKKCNTTLQRNTESEKALTLIGRCEDWLKNQERINPVLKWDTKSWGEIPADFGNKK
jgi:ribonuclease HI